MQTGASAGVRQRNATQQDLNLLSVSAFRGHSETNSPLLLVPSRPSPTLPRLPGAPRGARGCDRDRETLSGSSGVCCRDKDTQLDCRHVQPAAPVPTPRSFMSHHSGCLHASALRGLVLAIRSRGRKGGGVNNWECRECNSWVE